MKKVVFDEIQCNYCNKLFTPKRSRNTGFCCRSCWQKFKYHNTKKLFKCDNCGKDYYANEINNNRTPNNYCSKDCQMQAYWKLNRKNHVIIDNIEFKECSTCSQLIPIDLFRNDKSKWDGKYNVCNTCYTLYVRENWSKTIKGVIARKFSKAKRREREINAGDLSKIIINEIYNDNLNINSFIKCEYCGVDCTDNWHLEHKTPLCKDGKNEKDNLTISCPNCNLSKGRKTFNEFKQTS